MQTMQMECKRIMIEKEIFSTIMGKAGQAGNMVSMI